MKNIGIVEIESTEDYLNYIGEANKRWLLPIYFHIPSIYIFAVIEKTIIGCAYFCQNEFNSQKWYHSWLSVADDYQRRGIAQKIIETGIENLRKKSVKKLCCDIHQDNVASINLHKKLLFQINNNEEPPTNDWNIKEGHYIYERML